MNTTIPQALQEAITHQQSGRLQQAETIYQQILQAEPDHPDALHLLGMVAHQMGKDKVAVELIGRAIHVKPSEAMYHNNLGMVLESQGKLDAAAESFRQALLLKPGYDKANYNLASVLHTLGKLDSVDGSQDNAISSRPDSAGTYNNLGNALAQKGKEKTSMKKTLIFQWFNCDDPLRSSELTSCVEHNLKIGFDEIIIFNDSVKPQFFGENIINIQTDKRITYRDFINIVNDPNHYGSLVVLTNTDIMLSENFFRIADIIGINDFFCFTRYEANGEMANIPWCTQDVWAMLSQPVHNSIVFQSDIPLGMPGCEMRFSEIIFNVGYSVFNPSYDIKNIHLHSNQVPHKDENRMYGAFLCTPPCKLVDVKERNMTASTHYLSKFANKLFKIE